MRDAPAGVVIVVLKRILIKDISGIRLEKFFN